MTNLLAAFDFSDEYDSTSSVLAAIETLAEKGKTHIRLVHVFQPQLFMDAYTTTVDSQSLAEEQKASDRLNAIRARLEEAGYDATARILFMDPGPAIVEAAKSFAADCIILGSQGHGALRHLLLGSTTLHVLKQAPCPVYIMPVSAGRLGISPLPGPSLQQ